MMTGTRIKVGSLRDAYEAQRNDATRHHDVQALPL